MQTFLPYPSFIRSARVLDKKRLHKQCVETKQIIMALSGQSKWSNHPAVLMWQNYEAALCQYGIVMCQEAQRRGINSKELLSWFVNELRKRGSRITMPLWIGRGDLHKSHRANLTRKDPIHYNKYWIEEPQYGYLWPKRKVKGEIVEWVRIEQKH